MLPAVQLVIVRHAEAASGEPDELRPLTAEGRKAARALGPLDHAGRLRVEVIPESRIEPFRPIFDPIKIKVIQV